MQREVRQLVKRSDRQRPGKDEVVFLVDLQAFDPTLTAFEPLEELEFDVELGAQWVQLVRQLLVSCALDEEFVQEDAFDARRHHCIARVDEPALGQNAHAQGQLADQNEVLVENVRFEVP